MKHRFLIPLIAAALLSGCVKEIDKAANPNRPKPEWAVRGAGAFKTKDSAVFYGMGVANAMPNEALQRKTAELRARESIAATLQSSVRSLVKDYMEHHVDYFKPNGPASSEEIVSSTSEGVSDAQLDNCRIIDYWSDPQTGSLYALAKLDLNDGFFGSYKANLEKALREKGATVNIQDAEAVLEKLDADIQEQRFRSDAVVGATQPAPEPAPLEEP
jgi:hypothetical protein